MMGKNFMIIMIAVLFETFFSTSATAQYGYGNPYGNRYGRQRSTVPQAQTPQKAPEPLTAEELVDERMPSIAEALELNPFEEAVVRTTLVKYVQKRLELQILELEPKKMQEEFQKLGKLQNEEIKAGLPEDKYQAYLELEKNRFKAKKKKKKKKKTKE